MRTSDERKKLYAALSAPFPEECIQRTEGRVTGRGYDTAGIGYQYIVNRLNEVLGVGCFRAHRAVTVRPITTPKGRTAYEAICDLTLELGTWEDGEWKCWAEALADGGHTSFSEADARKGAFTNAFKKAAAFCGVGRQAYEGTLDEDNVPSEPVLTEPAPRVVRPVPAPAPAASSRSEDQPRRPVPTASTTPTARNRITSRQHAAIFSLARKAGVELANLRSQVKAQFSTNLEFLSREQASELIEALNRKINGNGHADTAGAEHHVN